MKQLPSGSWIVPGFFLGLAAWAVLIHEVVRLVWG